MLHQISSNLACGLLLIGLCEFATCQDKPAIPSSAERGAGLSADEVNQGWISLFDGTSLFGWQAESDANWRVEDGCIVVDMGSAPGLLRTTAQFDDYELTLEFQAEKDANSGVFVRTSPRPTDPETECFEINIAPSSNPYPTGSIVGHVKTNEEVASDDWHRMSISAFKEQVSVQIDDRPSATLADTAPFGCGYVGLQFNSGAVRFRNIRLKPMGLGKTFNGSDLKGWKTYEEMPGRFSIAPNGMLQARGGPGQLETENQFADFVLQFKCRTNAEGLNSGVFFRCIPGERMNGYEIQIDNTTVDGDRNKPKNGGTGAIFRRNEARRIVASDNEWSAITLVAVGPRIAVWVNGYQVTDWKDDRPKHVNPRNGRRLDAGTIMLQAHDETTDVSFADIFAAELSQREKGNGVDPQNK